MATATEIKVDMRDVDEATDFIERNKDALERSPKFAKHLADIMLKPSSYIFFQDNDGFHMELGIPFLQAIAAMRRGGCR